MKLKTLYLLLCLAGVILPYSQFLPWVAAHHGINLSLFIHELFANRISAFFGMDVFVSAVTLLVLNRIEGERAGIRGRWWVIPAVLSVGVSLGLPLFLYLKERAAERKLPAIV